MALHPVKIDAMSTDRIYRARRQEQSRNLESRNTKDDGLNAPTQNPGLDEPVSARDTQAFEDVTRYDIFDQSDTRGVCLQQSS